MGKVEGGCCLTLSVGRTFLVPPEMLLEPKQRKWRASRR